MPAARLRDRLRRLERLDVYGLRALVARLGVEGHLVTLLQGAEAASCDPGVMDEEILARLIGGDEPKALLVAEPLDCSCCHASSTACVLRSRRCWEATTTGARTTFTARVVRSDVMTLAAIGAQEAALPSAASRTVTTWVGFTPSRRPLSGSSNQARVPRLLRAAFSSAVAAAATVQATSSCSPVLSDSVHVTRPLYCRRRASLGGEGTTVGCRAPWSPPCGPNQPGGSEAYEHERIDARRAADRRRAAELARKSPGA